MYSRALTHQFRHIMCLGGGCWCHLWRLITIFISHSKIWTDMGRFHKTVHNTKFEPTLGWQVLRKNAMYLYSQYVDSTTCVGPTCAFLGHFDTPETVLVSCVSAFWAQSFFLITRKVLQKSFFKTETARSSVPQGYYFDVYWRQNLKIFTQCLKISF